MPWRRVDPQTVLNLVHGMCAATFVVSGDGYVLDVPEWMALTGQSASEAKGNGWLDAVHPDDVERVRAAWSTSIAHGTPYNVDYRVRCADGNYRWFNARASLVPGPDGNEGTWVGMMLTIPGTRRFQGAAEGGQFRLADTFDDISASALRAARAMLDWPADRLAREAGLARSTIGRLESGGQQERNRKSSIAKILKVLSGQPLRFIGSGSTIVGVTPLPTIQRNQKDAW